MIARLPSRSAQRRWRGQRPPLGHATLLLACSALASACASEQDLAASDLEPTARAREAVVQAPQGLSDFESGLYLPLNDFVLLESEAGRVVANGNVAVSFAGAALFGTVDENEALSGFDGNVPLRGAVTLELSADGGGEVDGSIALPVSALPTFPVGPNVMVQPLAFVQVSVSGNVEAGARASVVAPFATEIGFAFGDGAGTQQLRRTPAFHPLVGAPDAAGAVELDVEISVEVGVAFICVIHGVIVGGPEVRASLGLELGVNPSAPIWWTVDASTAISSGWSFGGTELVESWFGGDLVELYSNAWRLADADGPFPSALPTTRWSKVYDLQNTEQATSALPLADGFLVTGNGAGAGNRAFMTELNDAGDPRWQTSAVAQPYGSMRPTATAQSSSGDVFVVGQTGTSNGMRLERYEADGDPVWAKIMTGPSVLVKWSRILPTESDGAVLAGHITYVSGPSRPVFAEVDANGTLLWSSEVDLGAAASSPSISALSRTPNGDLLAVGTVSYTDSPSFWDATINHGNALVLRLDRFGSAVSGSAVGARGGETGRAVTVFEDGSYVLGGSAPTAGIDAAANGAWLAAFNADDSPRWSASYDGELGGGLSAVTGLQALPGNGAAVAGFNGIGAKTDGFLFAVDAAGMPLWFKSLRGPGEDTLAGLVRVGDGLLAYGHTRSVNDVLPLPQTDLWLMRTSVDGMLSFNEQSGFDAVNDAVRWQREHHHVTVPLTLTTLPVDLIATAAPLSVTAAVASIEVISD